MNTKAYWFRDYSQEVRDNMAESGQALPDGSFPIKNKSDLTNAISSMGRASYADNAKSHIIARAKDLSLTDLLPEDWDGSTKKASEPGVDDVHVPTVPPGKKNAASINAHFVKELYNQLKGKVGSMLDEQMFTDAVRTARAHSGGRTLAEKKREALAAAAKEMNDRSYSQIIEMVNAALQEEYSDPSPFAQPSVKFWYAQEVFPNYAIVKDSDSGCFYQVPYSVTDDEITLGDPVEVEQTYKPLAASDNILDLCSVSQTGKSKEYCLFNELPQDFSEAPARIPLLPKPGTYKHEKYGDVKITKERNQRFCDNINNAVYQSNLPIDSEHELDLSGAFGYIKAAELNGDGSVDATDVEWNDRGKKAFDENRFKYFSPKWWDSWTDPMTEQKFKDVVIGGALTTRPFFKEKALRPLIAREHSIVTTNGQTFSGVNDTMTKEQIEAARLLVKAAEAKAMTEALTGKTDDDIKKARALVAREDARIAAEKSAKDPDGDGDDDTTAAGDTDKSHFDDKGNKRPGMFDEQGMPCAAAKAASVKKTEADEAKEASERLSNLEAERKQFSDRIAQTELEAKRANERADASEKANRAMRFAEMSKDWQGERAKHVNLLEHFASTCDGGERSQEFKDYVELQRGTAAQFKEAGLFSEMGSSLGGSPDSPLGELEVKAAEIMKADPKLTSAQAFNAACERNPRVYDAYRASERGSVN